MSSFSFFVVLLGARQNILCVSLEASHLKERVTRDPVCGPSLKNSPNSTQFVRPRFRNSFWPRLCYMILYIGIEYIFKMTSHLKL